MSDARGNHNINKNEWDDPFSRRLLEILSSQLEALLRVAIEKIVDLGLGYTKESAELLILRSGLYHGFKDVTSNAVEGAIAFVRNGKQSGPVIFNLHELIEACLIEMVYLVRNCKPCASVFEVMWCLLLCDLNFWHAVALSGDQLGLVSIKDISSVLSEENGLKEDFNEAYYSQNISKLMYSKKPVKRELQSLNMNNFCARNVSREESSLALQNEIKCWTDWANKKVMQATRKLVNEKSELQMLRQWKEAQAKSNQTYEESIRKRLSEMEHAMSDATARTNTADLAVRKLLDKYSVLKKEVVAAKIKADRSAYELHEASKRVEEAMEKIRSTDRLKVALQEEFAALRRRNSDILRQLKIARGREEQHEVLRKREEAEKLKCHEDAMWKKSEIERLKAESKEKELKMREQAETLRRSLSSASPRLQVESGGGTGGFSRKSIQNLKTSSSQYTEAAKRLMTKFEADSMTLERECLICLSEEARVVLIPCAHQVLCLLCSVVHEEQGMTDCPKCRKRILMRIAVRSVDA